MQPLPLTMTMNHEWSEYFLEFRVVDLKASRALGVWDFDFSQTLRHWNLRNATFAEPPGVEMHTHKQLITSSECLVAPGCIACPWILNQTPRHRSLSMNSDSTSSARGASQTQASAGCGQSGSGFLPRSKKYICNMGVQFTTFGV